MEFSLFGNGFVKILPESIHSCEVHKCPSSPISSHPQHTANSLDPDDESSEDGCVVVMFRNSMESARYTLRV